MAIPTSRIALVEDHSLFAEALESALSLQGYEARRFVPAPDVRAAERVIAEVARYAPSLVLLDLDLGSAGDGTRLIKALIGNGAKVIVVTGSGDRARWGRAIAMGAKYVLSKTSPLRDIMAAVRRCEEGLPLMTRLEAEELVAAWRDAREETDEIWSRLDRLTNREAEVLGQLMAGVAVSEIARGRVVSESTVRTQVKAVLSKLQVGSQLGAVGLANKVGWRPPAEPQAQQTGQSHRPVQPRRR